MINIPISIGWGVRSPAYPPLPTPVNICISGRDEVTG